MGLDNIWFLFHYNVLLLLKVSIVHTLIVGQQF
jgi:hypothetical protein